MWLTSSSIGRKFIMALTGACLVLFVTFHVVMNSVCILWPAAYNAVCMFLGANWYALIASAGLAALFIIHIIYAVWLTVQNRKARGADRYEVTARQPQVEWASKNMLVLGIVILAFLVVHMIQFWAKMQLQELLGTTAEVDGVSAAPEFGTLFIQAAFSNIWVPIVYIIGFIALWFHMNHGFWSMFHTVGWDSNVWIERLKKIGCWWTTIVVALFIIEAVVFTVQANNKAYLTDINLQEQYADYWVEKSEEGNAKLNEVGGELMKQLQAGTIDDAQAQQKFEGAIREFKSELDVIMKAVDAQCPDVNSQALQQLRQMYNQIKMQYPDEVTSATDAAPAAVEFAEEEVELN
ncbi:MAG: succinate dehydrogenase cytochrome b subunit [Muribaculaceae bacterium]|nr:succinate dehydrogenase cytochrome b subunit [Muribaculaceae bacterium]